MENYKESYSSGRLVLFVSSLIIINVFQVTPGFSQLTLPPPQFSHRSGFYEKPFNLILSSGVAGAAIYYTLDGSEPHPENLEGTVYQYKNNWIHRPGDPDGDLMENSYFTRYYDSPVNIYDLSEEPDKLTGIASSFHHPAWYFPVIPVFKGTVVRAITVRDGLASEIITRTYFIDDLLRKRFSLPVIAIATNTSHLFDYQKGIYTPGIDFDNWRQVNPSRVSDGGTPANYHRRGVEWEYPAHFTFWDNGSAFPNLEQDIGFRIHGGWNRALPVKSLRLYARSNYGNSAFGFSFFQDKEYDQYKRLILRNSGNDNIYTMFRDAFIQQACRHMRFETQAYRPAVVFLNGEYWGIHNIRERYDKHYIKRVFKIEEKDLDLLTGRDAVKEGDNHHYHETLAYIREYGLYENVHYEYIQTRIDTDNFIDYQIANIFAANTDWPQGNIDFWRKRTSSLQPESPYGHDGRWRWMAFDMDFGFGLMTDIDHNTMTYAAHPNPDDIPKPAWSTFLLRNFLENEQFRLSFINRFADQLNTAFLPGRLNFIIDSLKKILEPDFQDHIDRWQRPASMSSWEHYTGRMREFARHRNKIKWGHLSEFFDLPEAVPVVVNVSNPAHGYIRINSIDIRAGTPGVDENAYTWKGFYFPGIPVRIEAVAKEGCVFKFWTGAVTGGAAVISGDPGNLGRLTAHFAPEIPERIINVFPNPVLENETLYLPEKMDFVLINSEGRKLLAGNNTNSVNLQGIPPGIYILNNQHGNYAKIVIIKP